MRALMFSLAILVGSPDLTRGQDLAAPTQAVGEHSRISTGAQQSMRDDVFANLICNEILKHQENGGAGPADLKLMVNSCFGGGLLDDVERVFGPGGSCAGIPWVAGAASEPNACAWGWSDATVNDPALVAKKLGSAWTDALAGTESSPTTTMPGAMYQGAATDRVVDDLQLAAALDAQGPAGRGNENPVIASGNGGHMIQWSGGEATKHEGICFGGNQTNDRHSNNVDKMRDALAHVWAADPHNIQVLDGGTTADLTMAIQTAVGNLDADTELAIYIDGHGGSSLDLDERLDCGQSSGCVTVDSVQGASFGFDLAEQLFPAIAGNARQGDPPVFSGFEITPSAAFDTGDYELLLNGFPQPLPGGILTSKTLVPIDYNFVNFWPYSNSVQILSLDPLKPSITLQIEWTTGNLNDIEAEDHTDQEWVRWGGVGNGLAFGLPGCLPQGQDTWIGSPGGTAPFQEGAAITSSVLISQDADLDGVIELGCFGTRDVFFDDNTSVEAFVDVDGTWDAFGSNVDMSATWTLTLESGQAFATANQSDFSLSSGSFLATGSSGAFVPANLGDTMQITGVMQFFGPPGFEVQTAFVISIDGTIVTVPEPAAGLGLASGALVLLCLQRTRTGRMRRP